MFKIFVPFYTVARLRAEPAATFVFGDNVQRVGTGGQAVIRHEGNAFGVPTKWRPSMHTSALFYDDDHDAQLEVMVGLDAIEEFLEQGKIVYWPKDGIGTGLSHWQIQAPKLLAYTQERVSAFLLQYGEER